MRSLDLDDETVAEPERFVGFDDDLAAEATRQRPVEDAFTPLDEQTVFVPGTDTVSLTAPSLANSLTAVPDQRELTAARRELRAHPLSKVLMSLPVIGIKTEVRVLIGVGVGAPNSRRPITPAAYTGLAPTTGSSGRSWPLRGRLAGIRTA
ncbi:hypothetical protein [Streptomyces sp. NPDC058385]|uniref:hypothetical protein n=1 Tax=Streptomyces sp. NPDC058385 TaxID=3346473 RepID=UPI00366724F0